MSTIENGVLDKSEQFTEICTRMVSRDMKFCPGLDKEYEQYHMK